VDGGWRSDSGASLPTYFMGATLYVFPNQFREYRAYQHPGLDERTAAVVALNLAGYHQEEIAELLSLPSPRTVEGILYRWRTKARQRTGTGGDGDAGE
jgi:hypothetical protein